MQKKKLKTFSWIIIILLIINMPFLFYLLNFRLIVFNENYYKNEFQKYSVYDKFPEEDIDKINHDLLLYLKTDKTQNLADIDFFTQKEKEHLLDVKNLIQKFILFFYITIFNIIALTAALYYLTKKKIKKYAPLVLLWGGILNFIGAFIFYLMVRLNFDWLFGVFHKLFFKAGSWIFDTNIVKLYPSEFFYGTAAKIVLNTLAMAFVAIIVGMLLFYNIKIKRYINKSKKSIYCLINKK